LLTAKLNNLNLLRNFEFSNTFNTILPSNENEENIIIVAHILGNNYNKAIFNLKIKRNLKN
jgi:hypothetical protein